jgi:allantoate deiminase
MIGSHIDTVANGGRYDGALGVTLGIDCVEALAREGRRFGFAIEVIAFGDEEGSRFPTSMTCSRAVTGEANPAALAMRDAEGQAFGAALDGFLAGAAAVKAARKRGDVLGFLEAHIEQGPVLESEGLALGVVTAIASQQRLLARFSGRAGHAGTTPMNLRLDPGPAAAEAILAVERICRARAGVVGTVGRMAAFPGGFNVIPGAVEISLDVRAPTSSQRDAAAAEIRAAFEEVATRRGLTVSLEVLQDLAESPCDPALTTLLEGAVRAAGVRPRRLPSGAGHDAMVMATLCPTAMLFIRCRGGISHNPAEWVDPADAALAARAMLGFIEALSASMEGRGAA